jgi:hypothetical protein
MTAGLREPDRTRVVTTDLEGALAMDTLQASPAAAPTRRRLDLSRYVFAKLQAADRADAIAAARAAGLG